MVREAGQMAGSRETTIRNIMAASRFRRSERLKLYQEKNEGLQ